MHMPCIYHAYTMHIPCIYHAYTMHIPCTYHAYTMHTPCTYLNALFAQLDRNGSGKVTLAEFQLVFASSVGGWRAAEAVVAEPVDAADREAYRALRVAQLQRRMELREADDETLTPAMTLTLTLTLTLPLTRRTMRPTSRVRGRAA